MESWEKELDQYLAPHGVVFSQEASAKVFKKEMRIMLNQTRLPLFSHALLYDGAGSLITRIVSILMLVGIYIQLIQKHGLPETSLVIICLAASSLPGLWMWWYSLMPSQKRIHSMRMLFDKKIKERQQYPSSLRS